MSERYERFEKALEELGKAQKVLIEAEELFLAEAGWKQSELGYAWTKWDMCEVRPEAVRKEIESIKIFPGYTWI